MITSLENSKIKYLIKLKDKQFRDNEQKFLVEGMHLVEEALKANLLLEIYTVSLINCFDIPINLVNEAVMNKITSFVSEGKIIGICKKKEDSLILGNKIVLLDDIQDPGNLGAIIRSSLAFNIETIVLSNNCCDIYNEKVLRGTQGAIFYVNIIKTDLSKAITDIRAKSIPIYGTNVKNGIDVREITNDGAYALVMGNEGRGVSSYLQSCCDKNIYIKTNKKLESLNVAIATSIILYELNKE